MSKYDMTPEKIARWIKEGRGRGKLGEYKPWLTNRDVPSLGWRLRIRGFITGRNHIMLSESEAKIFRPLDLSPFTKDIREQFPLPLEETLAIAKALGVKHPTDPKTKHYVVMTTDFLWDIGEGIQMAIDSKPQDELVKHRVIEKLEIVRIFWHIHHIKWKLSIDSDISPILSDNCARFHGNLYLDGLKINTRDVMDVAQVLTDEVYKQKLVLRNIARNADDRFGLHPGTSLRVAFHLMARRYWQVDWYVPQEGNSTIQLLGHNNEYDFSQSFRLQVDKE